MNKLERGLIHVYTGDGKGKTTAALGLALRAAGCGFCTYFCQFLKGQQYGELIFLKGVGWAPLEGMTQVWDRERAVRQIDMAIAANMNLFRMWAGGNPPPRFRPPRRGRSRGPDSRL